MMSFSVEISLQSIRSLSYFGKGLPHRIHGGETGAGESLPFRAALLQSGGGPSLPQVFHQTGEIAPVEEGLHIGGSVRHLQEDKATLGDWTFIRPSTMAWTNSRPKDASSTGSKVPRSC